MQEKYRCNLNLISIRNTNNASHIIMILELHAQLGKAAKLINGSLTSIVLSLIKAFVCPSPPSSPPFSSPYPPCAQGWMQKPMNSYPVNQSAPKQVVHIGSFMHAECLAQRPINRCHGQGSSATKESSPGNSAWGS